MKHIHESIIGRKGIDKNRTDMLMPGDIVEYDFRDTHFWRFIPKRYIPDGVWKDILKANPPKNSNLLVALAWSNNKSYYCTWVDLGNIIRPDELVGNRFGQVWRQKDVWVYEKPEDLRIMLNDLETARIIKED